MRHHDIHCSLQIKSLLKAKAMHTLAAMCSVPIQHGMNCTNLDLCIISVVHNLYTDPKTLSHQSVACHRGLHPVPQVLGVLLDCVLNCFSLFLLLLTLACCRLQALQAAADSVLTPRWQTELGTRQVHQHPFRSSLQYQAAQDTEVGIHQQPFSSSLQFQAAHDTDFHQQLDGDTLHRSARPDTAVSPAHAATVDPVSHNQVNQVDAAHAADVEFAAIYMRNHEMDSSRHVDCSDFRGAAASSSSGSSRMTQNKISPAVGNSQNGLESRMDSMAVHSVSSSSSNSTSSSDIGAASAHHSHGSSSPVAHSSRSDTHAADEARPATIGRVLGPRNAVDVAVRGSAATEAPSKHVSHAERAVGLVEPTAYTGTAPSLDIMIKTGHVVSLVQ